MSEPATRRQLDPGLARNQCLQFALAFLDPIPGLDAAHRTATAITLSERWLPMLSAPLTDDERSLRQTAMAAAVTLVRQPLASNPSPRPAAPSRPDAPGGDMNPAAWADAVLRSTMKIEQWLRGVAPKAARPVPTTRLPAQQAPATQPSASSPGSVSASPARTAPDLSQQPPVRSESRETIPLPSMPAG